MMAFFDVFKNKKRTAPRGMAVKKAKERKAAPRAAGGKPSVDIKPTDAKAMAGKPTPSRKKAAFPNAYKILKAPLMSEKATDLSAANQYVFIVSMAANKNEIRKAVEGVYGVDVDWVNIINIPAKQRVVGRHRGWKSGYKKAIVKISKGQKIEILPR